MFRSSKCRGEGDRTYPEYISVGIYRLDNECTFLWTHLGFVRFDSLWILYSLYGLSYARS